MNIITTVGYLTADPALSTTPNGQQVCKFRLGSQNKRRDDNNQFMTNFYNCTVWGKMGETISKFFHKGSRIMVSGDLTIRDYVDKTGASRTSIDIDVRDFDFGERNQGGQQPVQQPQPQRPVPQAPQMTYAPPVAQAAPVYAAPAQPMYAQPAAPTTAVPPQPYYQPATAADDALPF